MRGPVNLPEDFDPKAQEHKKFANTFPTRENCDLTNPYEMFLWMLVGLPGVNGAQQVMPTSYNRLVSKHLHDLGAMLQCDQCGHTKVPGLTYVPPAAEDPHWLTSPGRWVDPAKVPQREGNPIDVALDALTSQQQSALFARLKERHEKGTI